MVAPHYLLIKKKKKTPHHSDPHLWWMISWDHLQQEDLEIKIHMKTILVIITTKLLRCTKTKISHDRTQIQLTINQSIRGVHI